MSDSGSLISQGLRIQLAQGFLHVEVCLRYSAGQSPKLVMNNGPSYQELPATLDLSSLSIFGGPSWPWSATPSLASIGAVIHSLLACASGALLHVPNHPTGAFGNSGGGRDTSKVP